MRAELPTGTVTFLFTDIEGSTRLLHALGPDAYAEALAEHRRLLRDAFAAHGGVEVDTQGDAFFVAFPTAPGAAAAARAAQQALASGPIRVRMGLHTGAPTPTGEGYVGADVHQGARVAALANGGQVLLTPSTAALLDGEALVDLGTHRLKDFDGATRLHQLGAGQHPPLRSPGTIQLPTPATAFLGREHELFEAVALVLEHDPRVLTILGPGGTGKTRFAIELARLLAEDADGGTLFVPLAPIHDPALMLPRLAEALGAQSGEPASIADRVAGKRTRVILDNLEQLLPDAAGAVAELAAVPGLRLLVTSREGLRIGAETRLDLPPLSALEAAELFLARTRAVGRDLTRTPTVDELCRRLDRLPLAIELAAARTTILAPDALLARLGQRLDVLRGSRDSADRHSTLRATISWSHDLLDAPEQRLFARLAVFAAGCTLESAEAVCEADLTALESLFDKSLVRQRVDALGGDRFWMLETIREYAAERLRSSGELERLRERHARRLLEIAAAADLAEEAQAPPQLRVALAERDDLRAALDWAAEADLEIAAELVLALENFWTVHAPHEGARRVLALLDRADGLPPAQRARALRVLGGTLYMSGDPEQSELHTEESLRIYTELADERGIASTAHRLAIGAVMRGERDTARSLLDQSMTLCQGRFPFIETSNYAVLGRLLLAEGEVEEGTRVTRRGADLARELGWDWWLSGQLGNLLFLALDRGDLEEAERVGREALRLEWEHENRHWALYALTGLARLALERGQLELAGELWGAVEAEGERARYGTWNAARAELAAALLRETSPEFAAGRDRGLGLDLWDAAALALAGDQTVP
jgi:predicted ATPase/class 3 adenylate cyclase